MGTVQHRFEVDQPASAVYDAVSAPADILQKMPGVTGVTSLSPDLYRVIFGAAESPRQVDLQLTRHPELRRVEWRTVDGGWTGAVTAEPIGPARSAVGVHAESVQPDVESPPPSLIHDALQAFKRVLQSREIHVSHGMSGARPTSARHASPDARGFASEWRNVARSAFSRPAEYPFALMRTVSRQVDRLWGDIWRGTPIAKLPHMVPGLHWNPDVEVCEQDDQVRICLDVPGVDETNLQVEVDEGYLTIRGDRQDERATDPGHRRTEVHYGAFTRRIPLPDGIDPDSARAVLRNGVLEVRIALHRREPRKVPVQHAS
ncbi:MAG: Hsp20 family protein [Betaproteobacteria bacterium]|nr:Hsp20 family protein [Betaproteobacteria bacterium]